MPGVLALGALLLAVPLLALAARNSSTSRPGHFYQAPYTNLPPVDAEDNQHIVIHIVPHTHDDVGWLETVDEYYLDQVQWILYTAIQNLKDNPERKFTYVENAYFFRWWREQTEEMKDSVRQLVREGRLEFNLGGWCMNDEATPIYWQEIDQMTQGAQFLAREIGAYPTVGWHVDPFGHSSSTPSMWQQMGMNAFGFARIHYALADQLARTKSMEFIWRSSDSKGQTNDMWSYILPDGYCTPGECGYDGGLIVDNDPLLPTYQMNIAQQAQDFVNMARGRLQFVRHNQILIPFGCDFAHQNAYHSFVQMDKLIAYVNANPSLNATVQYSFFSDYVKAVHALNITWPVWTPSDGDFFPYADHPHAYWTGYYTSRPALKQFIRSRAAVARAAEMVTTIVGAYAPASFNKTATVAQLDIMRQALGVAQHHDAVSGTEKQHVADDYTKQLQQGTVACVGILNNFAGAMLSLSSPPTLTVDSGALESLAAGQYLPVVVFNTLGWSRRDYVSILTKRKDIVVFDSQGNLQNSQINPIAPFSADAGTYTQRLFFQPSVPALGTRTYFLAVDAGRAVVGTVTPGLVNISNHAYSLNFNPATGRWISMTNTVTGISKQVNQEYYEYVSASQSEQNSGAYVFRPEQDNRLGVGDNEDNSHPLKSTSWSFIDAFPVSAKPIVILTPWADATYMDSFSSNVRVLSLTKFSITTGRLDAQVSPPWGQSVSADFLAIDSTQPFLQGFQSGAADVGPAPATSFKVVLVTFPRAFGEVPRVIATVQASRDIDQLFVASIIAVNAQGFSVNVTSPRGTWTQALAVNWLAWDSAAARALPASYSEGSASASISKDGNTARFSFNLSPSLPVLDPILLVGAVSAVHPVAVTAVSSSPTGMAINVVCVGCNFKAGESLHINWLSFVRNYFGANVTDAPLNGTQSVTGPFVSEVWQPFRANYATQTLRLYRDDAQSPDNAYVEVINDIGPLDKGRELVTRFSTSLQTSTSPTTGLFYTDDNGLEMLTRKYNVVSDEPIAGNYFPASSRAILKENDQSAQFTVVMTSSHGCGSTTSGHIELMLHRRCLKDDGYGVGEVLDEATHVDPALYVVLDTPANSASEHRRLALLKEFPSTLLFAAPVSSIGQFKYPTQTSELSANLPANVHLLSLNAQEGYATTIWRLQHLYPVNEHPTLSQPVTVDLPLLFQFIKPSNIAETTLSANQVASDVRRPVWYGEDGFVTPLTRGTEDAPSTITLQPRDLRTFVAELSA